MMLIDSELTRKKLNRVLVSLSAIFIAHVGGIDLKNGANQRTCLEILQRLPDPCEALSMEISKSSFSKLP